MQTPQQSGYVYVIFHGLWTFEISDDKQYILAHTPREHDHRVAAGYLIPGSEPQSEAGLLDLPGGELQLVGVQPGTQKRFRNDLNAWIGKGQIERPHLRHCVIKLPLAEDIHSARRVNVTRPPHHPFAHVDGETMQPNIVSMVQVFEYAVTGRPDIQPPTGVPLDNSGDRLKLHVFAEPVAFHEPFHARNAYTRMAGIFGLEIVPITELFTPPDSSNVPGLTDEDTIGFTDLLLKAADRGESGSNCDALIIDRTKYGTGPENAG